MASAALIVFLLIPKFWLLASAVHTVRRLLLCVDRKLILDLRQELFLIPENSGLVENQLNWRSVDVSVHFYHFRLDARSGKIILVEKEPITKTAT